MQNHPFNVTGWHRFLFGDASAAFLLEVLLRTGLTWFLLTVTMRLLGRRVAAQYTLFEISIAVTLAAAIGVPLQASNRGMLPPLVIALVAVVLQRTLARAGTKSRRVETLISTDVTLLVSDGRLDARALRRTAMPKEKVFEAIRMRGLQHLGQIGRLYMEPSGAFSVVPARPVRPGLTVLPRIDTELVREGAVQGWYVCEQCGGALEAQHQPDAPCAHCDGSRWMPAVRELER
jgi:uncharacterized membrane protein YcaP (DUF421 family)